MKPRDCRFDLSKPFFCRAVVVFCNLTVLLLVFSICSAQTQTPEAQSQVMTTTSPAPEAPKIPNDQLDSLVAPIALYSDPLLANTLAASTYPLEVVQMQQWMDRNKKLKDKALADAVAKQNWDPSVQSLAATPEVLQRLAGNIQWTADLGNAFLAQQSDVMDAVQRMRAKAESKGTLKTSAQQRVQTQTVEGGKQVIVIENTDPQVVYVPSYDPAVMYGPPAYPYYPYYYPGWYAGMGLALGAGIAWGAYWGNHWGDCDWGHGDVNINNNNNFNRNNWNNNNRPGQGGNRPGQGNRPGAGNRPSQMPAGGKWGHNPSHRGNAPYGDRGTSNRFGQANNRPGAGGNRPGAGNRPSQLPAGGNRPGAGAGNRPSTRPSGGNRPGGGAGARPSTRPSGGNRVGNHAASRSSYGNRGGGFGGGGGSFARSSSNRGGRSMGGGGFSRGGGGGGFRGGGGGRGGGGRGGGGGRR